MNIKRYLLASLAVCVAFMVMDFVIHNLILGETYRALASLWRPDMMSMMWVMWITTIALSLIIVYIFAKGYEGKGILEGIRFGIIIGLLLGGIGSINQYIVYPLPFSLAAKWICFFMIEFIIAGIIASLIYKPKNA